MFEPFEGESPGIPLGCITQAARVGRLNIPASQVARSVPPPTFGRPNTPQETKDGGARHPGARDAHLTLLLSLPSSHGLTLLSESPHRPPLLTCLSSRPAAPHATAAPANWLCRRRGPLLSPGVPPSAPRRPRHAAAARARRGRSSSPPGSTARAPPPPHTG